MKLIGALSLTGRGLVEICKVEKSSVAVAIKVNISIDFTSSLFSFDLIKRESISRLVEPFGKLRRGGRRKFPGF